MRFSQLEGKRIGLWGAGAETLSLTRALARMGVDARIEALTVDHPAGLPSELELAALAPVVAPSEAVSRFSACDLVVRSPRVSIHRPEIRELIAAGVTVTTATGLWFAELADRLPPAQLIGVTGSKGKSTTCSMLAHALRRQGASVELAGNIGLPVTELLGRDEPDFYVVELSSFQIADLTRGPRIAVFTSLTSAHLDWHQSDAFYHADKTRLAGLPGVEHVVINGESEALDDLHPAAPVETHRYGRDQAVHVIERGVESGAELTIAAEDLPLPGRHNLLNACAVVTVLELLGRPLEPRSKLLSDFRGLPHRLERHAERGGVVWVDDNYGSIPDATIAALRTYAAAPIVLIAGGSDRGQDFSALIAEASASDVTLICFAASGQRLASEAAAAGLAPGRRLLVDDLQAAVGSAARLARPGATVLHSPASGAYEDDYANCEQRGAAFKRAVDALPPAQ